MGDRGELRSSLQRARIGLRAWFDLLPEDAKLDADMALSKLFGTVNNEIEQAYLWLKFIQGPGWAPSGVMQNGVFENGVAASVR